MDKVHNHARSGIMHTMHGSVETPAFLPIGTRGSVKAVTTEELKFWGAQIILANTYHLWQRPSDALIRKAGGLHKFMGWEGPILTDSGGFQIFSLRDPTTRNGRETSPNQRQTQRGIGAEEIKRPRVLSITDAGVKFRSETDGSEHMLSPEVSMQIQRNLGSDIALVLDEFPRYPASFEETELAVQRTHDWAQRSIKEFFRLGNMAVNPGQVLFGIIQGGTFDDLRKKSAKQMRELDFPGYALGGLAVGEPVEKMYEAVEQVVPLLEETKPRHLLGAGTPEQIVRAVARGIDTFDCVLPTRNARHAELFVSLKAGQTALSADLSAGSAVLAEKEATLAKAEAGYSTIRITNEYYKEDFTPVDNTCNCYGCLNFTRAYLRHLFMAREPLALRLATMHNLRFYLNLMERIRRAIQYGSFDDMVKNYREQ